MLPTLADFNISSPVYLRKINSRGRWNLENTGSENLIQKVVDGNFNKDNNIYSLWLVNSDEDLYGIISALSADRNPKDQDIDFIYLTPEEIENLSIKIEQTTEGKCLAVADLHHNATIPKEIAYQLCQLLKIKNTREAQRCKRKQTKAILEHQKEKGCKAVEPLSEKCYCQSVYQL